MSRLCGCLAVAALLLFAQPASAGELTQASSNWLSHALIFNSAELVYAAEKMEENPCPTNPDCDIKLDVLERADLARQHAAHLADAASILLVTHNGDNAKGLKFSEYEIIFEKSMAGLDFVVKTSTLMRDTGRPYIFSKLFGAAEYLKPIIEQAMNQIEYEPS